MANTSNSDKWYFTKEQLETTPSRLCGFDAYKELQYRQQAANFIQDMGQRLKVSQLCINTAIVYMHRFYVFHSFTDFPWYQMAAAALFLAAKVEEQPRKLEYVIRVANICKNPRDSAFDINSERYIAQSQDLVFNENVLLQTLGFDVAIDHPHTYVVRCCHLVRASKDLAQTSYFMASNSLHLTTMCIQYKPTVVACFCILLACKWSNWEIPLSNESKEWFTYVDQSVTAELLEQLTSEFLVIFENCPSRLKEKIMTKQDNFSSPGDQDKKQDGSSRSLEYKGDDPHKHRQGRPHEASSSGHRTQEQKEREYKERKEKERIAHMSGITLPHQPHHHRTIDQKVKPHARPPSNPCFPPGRNEPRDILREASKEPSFGIPAVLHDPSRDHGKETNLPGRSDKEVSKRDPLLKPNVQTDMNSLNNYTDIRQRTDPNRPRMDPKTASKQELLRRYEEQKAPHVRSDADNIKKHLSSSYDKNSAYLKSTSQKIKSPFNLDNKSVPKTTTTPVSVPIAKPHYNGNTNGSYNKTISHHDHELNKSKTEVPPVKEDEIPTPAFIKRPSLFSPEKTPPQHKSEKSESLTNIPITNLTALSPINSPSSVQSNRNRNYSSSSEPELRPTMKKIDQVEGFETLMRDNTIGVGSMHTVTDSAPGRAEENLINQPQATSELKRTSSPNKDAPNLQSVIVNGLETNPTIISNLLKEAATNSHLPSMAPAPAKPTEPVEPSSVAVPPPEHKDKEHHHHKSKKKKEKHKHKDKSKEEKEKKKKHKDKDKEKHKHKDRKEVELPVPVVSEPIKIKIQKDKIQPLNELKIKIPKDKIITDGMMDPLPQPSSGGLKIKIPKEVITNCGTSSGSSLSNSVDLSVTGSNRKRERERVSPKDNPPLKQTKFHHKDSKQNGRPSYNKVSENNNHSNEYLDNYALIDSSETSLVKDQTLKIVSPLNDNNNSQFFPSKTPALCDNVSKAQNSAACSDDTNKRTSESTQKVSQVSKLYTDSTNESDHKTLPAAKSNTPQTNQAPYKYNNNNSFKGNNTSFQKHNGFEEYSMPYHSKGNRPNFNQQPPRYPRHPQLRHPPPGGPKLYRPPPNQNHLPQSYTTPPPMPFSSYVMPPPMIPNMNVPPPPYMYQPFYHSYNVYPDIYQQPNLLVGLNPPPLPPEAPPNDIPPPPPPDEA